MKQYIVTGKTVSFNTGTKLELSEKQVSDRVHALNFVKGNVFEVVSRVEFKVGEKLGYDGPVSKALLEFLAPVDSEEAKATIEQVEARKKAAKEKTEEYERQQNAGRPKEKKGKADKKADETAADNGEQK